MGFSSTGAYLQNDFLDGAYSRKDTSVGQFPKREELSTYINFMYLKQS